MKPHFFVAFRLTMVSVVLLMVLYPLVIWMVAKAAPGNGNGETIIFKGKVVGYRLVGQNFTNDKYFNSRPSAAGYNAAGSSGSNKGPTNPEYLKQVRDRLDTFMVHNLTVSKTEIPSELITASGSGLDPDLSVKAALIQVVRIAKARNIEAGKVARLVEKNTKTPLLGVFGPSHVNILQLNIELDKLCN